MHIEEWFEKVYYEIYFFDSIFSYDDYFSSTLIIHLQKR